MVSHLKNQRYSTNDGDSWTTANTGLTYYNVTALVSSGPNLFAATSGGGIFLSSNIGANWKAVNTGLANLEIESMIVAGSDIYVGTSASGVWHRHLSDFENAAVTENPATSFKLSPNPTSGILSMQDVPAESHVCVMNMLGQTVLEIVNPSSADLTLDLSGLLPGTYCVRLVSPEISVTKMIVRE